MAQNISATERSSVDSTVVPASALVCFSVLGFTTGIYVGLSDSPVVGGFVGGVLSLITGGALTFLIGKDNAPSLSAKHVTALSKCIIAYCILSLTGSCLGIVLREDIFGFLKPAKPASVELTRLSPDPGAIPRDVYVKIALLQQLLKQHRIDNTENNAIVQLFLDGAKDGNEVRTLTNSERLESINTFLWMTRNIAYYNMRLRSWLHSADAEFAALIESQKESKDYAQRKESLSILRQLISELPDIQLKDSDAALKDFYAVRQPHLDVLLDKLLSSPAHNQHSADSSNDSSQAKFSMKRPAITGVPIRDK